MKTRDKPRQDWTVVLRRQPVRIVDRHPEGGYTSMFEIICCDMLVSNPRHVEGLWSLVCGERWHLWSTPQAKAVRCLDSPLVAKDPLAT
jgi:hypothetical protein